MNNTYEEKKQAKIERYKELAQKYDHQSMEAYENSNKLASVIPFGQPILVGHHSEGHHRAHIKRIHNAMNKSCELQNKAEYYKKRAESAENNNIISSDDPDAINKLKNKLENLEALRTKYKEHNKQARKEQKETLPSFVLANLGANIRTAKQRIIQLEKQKGRTTKEHVFNEYKIVENAELNRLQIHFNKKPDYNTRSNLKRWGFRWSPSMGVWQRQLNNTARYAVKMALNI